MKILIGGGGTGGHIYPALALARYARAVDEKNEILFVGSAAGLESRIVPAAGFSLSTIPARGFQRSFRQLGAVGKDLLRGLYGSVGIINSFRPNVVLGTGGYVAAPLVLAAVFKRCPAVIHEQNAIPGLTNRRLAPLVKRVCLSFAGSEKKLPRSSRITFTGNPRAGEVAALTRGEGCRRIGLDPGRLNILVYGGSRGAQQLNRVVVDFIKAALLPDKATLVYVTGDIYYDEVKDELGSLPAGVRLYAYLEEMPWALAAADLAVTRSGATTLAEITALGVPAVLVPSPNVVENHQYYNARLLADAGAAILVEEKDFDHHRLAAEISTLIGDQALIKRMSENSRKLAVPDAAARLYRCLQEVAS